MSTAAAGGTANVADPDPTDIRDLLARIAALEARVAAAEARTAEAPGVPADAQPVPRSRRALIGAAGAAVAGAAGGALLRSTPAAAADGSNMVIGRLNTAPSPTTLRYDTASTDYPDYHLVVSADNAPVQRSGLLVDGNFDGVTGYSGSSGYGVLGWSPDAAGVVGTSDTGVDFYAAGTGRILLEPHVAFGPPSQGEHFAGELVCDGAGDWWACVADGTPGTWRTFAVNQLGVGSLHMFSQGVRVLDTFTTGGTVGARQVRTCNLPPTVFPAGTTAVVGTLIAYSPDAFTTPFAAEGFASIFLPGGGATGVTLAWPAGAMYFSGSFTAAVKALALNVTTATTAHFTMDVFGYYQ